MSLCATTRDEFMICKWLRMLAPSRRLKESHITFGGRSPSSTWQEVEDIDDGRSSIAHHMKAPWVPSMRGCRQLRAVEAKGGSDVSKSLKVILGSTCLALGRIVVRAKPRDDCAIVVPR